MGERIKYLISRFGMLIPFALTVLMLIVSKSVEEPHAGRAETAMWVFCVMFVIWLVSWLVRVGIHSGKVWKWLNEVGSKFKK